MTWLANQGTYLAGQEAVDSVDLVALECERKFGADRLRTLVPEELRTKFDRQRKLTNDAITSGELADVLRECKRMQTAWKALDKVASENPANFLPPTIFEVPSADGSVIQIVREANMAGMAAAEAVQSGRMVRVFTLEEVGRILDKLPSLYSVKDYFPGATVTAIRQNVGDPWDGAPDMTVATVADAKLVEEVARIIEPDAWAWNVWSIWPTRSARQAEARAKAQRIVGLVLNTDMTITKLPDGSVFFTAIAP